ncbi:hypothetical protein HDU76_007668 [Blyttiomyces sp. JEL0837]|nr:hypothetical protein HDU76_007668 [Blyttiomyces sp. JEL0837]
MINNSVPTNNNNSSVLDSAQSQPSSEPNPVQNIHPVKVTVDQSVVKRRKDRNGNRDSDIGDDKDGGDTGLYLYLPIPEGKKGQKALGDCLEIGVGFLELVLKRGGRVLVHCAQGKDRSVCVVLAFLVTYLKYNGSQFQLDLTDPVVKESVTKQQIQDRLMYIQQFRTKAQPSRTNLKRVNTHFMEINDGGK